MTTNGYSEKEIREMSMKEYRKNIPSGWMEVARFESIVLILDALLSSPPSREYSSEELAEEAGIGVRSYNDRIDSLVRLGIVNQLDDGRENTRYSLNEKSPIVQRLFQLNKTVEKVKSDDFPKSLPDDWGMEDGVERPVFDVPYGDPVSHSSDASIANSPEAD